MQCSKGVWPGDPYISLLPSVETALPVTPSAPCIEVRVGGSKTELKLCGFLALNMHNAEMGEEQAIIDGVILASIPRLFDMFYDMAS